MTTMYWSWKTAQKAGKLSVVSGIDEKGNLKTTEAEATNQASFLKFNSKDGLPKNFMDNFGGHIVFPILSNQKMNAYLKEIADLCDIKKNLTFHLVRHREFYKHQIIR